MCLAAICRSTELMSQAWIRLKRQFSWWSLSSASCRLWRQHATNFIGQSFQPLSRLSSTAQPWWRSMLVLFPSVTGHGSITWVWNLAKVKWTRKMLSWKARCNVALQPAISGILFGDWEAVPRSFACCGASQVRAGYLHAFHPYYGCISKCGPQCQITPAASRASCGTDARAARVAKQSATIANFRKMWAARARPALPACTASCLIRRYKQYMIIYDPTFLGSALIWLWIERFKRSLKGLKTTMDDAGNVQGWWFSEHNFWKLWSIWRRSECRWM